MVLTDNGGLVKMYAMVNVEQYNLVVTAESQEEVFAKYRKLIAKNQNSDADKTEESIKDTEFVVADMEYVTMSGETYVYNKDEAGSVFKQKFADDESVIKISVGDTISIRYEENESGIHTIITVELKEKGTGSVVGGDKESDTATEQENTTDNTSESATESEKDAKDSSTTEEEKTTEYEGNSI